jgi:Transmembrane family, TMEM144 of transporters
VVADTIRVFYAIRQYTGSSFIVLVSFIWGIFVFGERIHSQFSACFAIFCMMLGLFGMSYYSSPQTTATMMYDTNISEQGVGAAYQGVGRSSDEDDDEIEAELDADTNAPDTGTKLEDQPIGMHSRRPYSDNHLAATEEEATLSIADAGLSLPSTACPPAVIVMVEVCGHKIAKRKLGMMAAAFCGIWGGSIMAPMKYCQANTKGTHYLLSFSIGASIVTVAFWFLRYSYHVVRCRSLVAAYECLPSFHLRVMWLAGGTSGLLWSIGNFFSLISVFYLGEGVGYPLVQTSILVSGLWGIFYFKEVKGTERISKWLLSSLVTIFGILLLSYEHHEK